MVPNFGPVPSLFGFENGRLVLRRSGQGLGKTRKEHSKRRPTKTRLKD